MHVLFLHQSFPAQFGRLALELKRRYRWQCTFLVEDLGTCPAPAPELLAELSVQRLPARRQRGEIVPWQQIYAQSLQHGLAVVEGVRSLPGPRPDLVVAHQTLAPTLFLPEALSCPLVQYCEYYYGLRQRDLTYRSDLPPPPLAPFYPRCVNAPILTELTVCDGAYAPTHWQKHVFPERYWPRIEVHFDGIDTQQYRPREIPRAGAAQLLAGCAVPEGTRIVTYVARGLESMRGFDLFMQVARRICRERSDVLFVVVGGELSCYGWDRLHTGRWSFKEWVLAQGDYDPAHFVFLGQIVPEHLAELLCLSDLHLYLTVPFVLSWSLFNALACGCVVLASDVPPVRELIEPGVNGLVENLFDVDRLTRTALEVLEDPAKYQPLGKAGRALVESKYSLAVAVPELMEYYERVATAGTRSTRAGS